MLQVASSKSRPLEIRTTAPPPFARLWQDSRPTGDEWHLLLK